MARVLALLTFVVLSAVCRAASVALFRSTLDATDPAAAPGHAATPAVAVGVAALTGLVPFPAGYLARLVVWAVAAFGGLGLTAGRPAVLFADLAVSSFVARLVVLGLPDLAAK